MSDERCGTELEPQKVKIGASKVLNIDAAREKKKAKEDAPKKISVEEKVNYFVSVMKAGKDSPGLGPKWPSMGRKFYVILDELGIARIVEEKESGVLTNHATKPLENILIEYSRTYAPPMFQLTLASARETLAAFIGGAEKLNEELIVPIREKSQEGLCWHRMDWDLAEGDTQTFDEIMLRMTNSDAFMAFVGSLFIKDSDRQQYVWIMGDGNDSKSSLGRFLAEVLGPSYRAEYVPKDGKINNFWTAAFLGKRLAVFPDCDAYSFPTTGIFKSLTGDDPIRMEYKCQQSFTAKLPTKFLYFGNGDPEIGSGRANKRRLIYCRMSQVKGELLATETYHRKLWVEGAAWLWKCRQKYLELTDNGIKPIPANDDEVTQIISETEEHFETTFNQYFVNVEIKEPYNELPYITPEALQVFMRKCMNWDQTQQTKFRRWLKRERGVHKHSVKAGGTSDHRYLGAEWSKSYAEANPNWVKKAPPTDMKTKGDGADSH